MMDIIKFINDNLGDNEVNLIISGCTCSGKTTLAKQLSEHFKDNPVCIVKQDDYYKDLYSIPKTKNGYLMDSINAFHSYEFKNDVEQLLVNKVIYIPDYDFNTNKRKNKKIHIEKGQINIFEGLHTITLLKHLNNSLSVYLDTSLETCLKRRLVRDRNLYNIDEKRIHEYFKDCMIPMYELYILPQKKDADFIVSEGGDIKWMTLKKSVRN